MPINRSKRPVNDQRVLTQILQRLDQLDQNVVQGFQGVDLRFAQIDHRLNHVDQRLDRVDERLDQVDQRLNQVDARLDGFDQSIASMAQRFDNNEARLERVETAVVQLGQRITQVDEQIRSEIKIEIRGILEMLPEIGDDLLRRINKVYTEFSAFRDVSLMTWAEIKRHLVKQSDEHEGIKQSMSEFQGQVEALQQTCTQHEHRIGKLEAAQQAPTRAYPEPGISTPEAP